MCWQEVGAGLSQRECGPVWSWIEGVAMVRVQVPQGGWCCVGEVVTVVAVVVPVALCVVAWLLVVVAAVLDRMVTRRRAVGLPTERAAPARDPSPAPLVDARLPGPG